MSLPVSHADLCSDAVVEFVGGVTMQLWRSNALMVANAILVAIMVAASALGRRYRYAAVTRFLFQGASTLYLPIVSYVASSIGKESCSMSGGLDVFCHGRSYVALLLIWTVLVQIVGTNTSAVVAADDYHCGQNLSPLIQLLFRTVWTSYLVFYYAGRGFVTETSPYYTRLSSILFYKMLSQYLVVLCLLSLAKIMLMWYAFQKARKSFALGRNSHLIAGYMEKLQGDDESPLEAGLSPAPAVALCGHPNQMIPPFIVMGEDKQQIEETPHGYSIKQINASLVTVDMVWRMSATGDALLASQPWLKDLCLSFALSKLLTRRFAKAHIAESGSAKAFSFVLDVLLNNGSADRVFRVMADEISFILDFYYSSLPTSNFGRLLPILNFIVSLSVIGWCITGGAIISEHYSVHSHRNQIYCRPEPMSSCMFPPQYLNDGYRIAFGSIHFNTLPTLSLFAAVIVAEAWQIVSYLCSNWVKVTMLCHYMTHASWQESPRVQRWLGVLMKLRIRFRRSWSDHIGQRSLLPPSIGRQYACRTMMCRLFFCFSDQKMQYVKVPIEVKAAIVDALRRSNGTLTKGTAALDKHSSIIGNSLRWACEGQGTSDVILAWHIATGMVETSTCSSIRSSAANANRAVAMHLSRYCAYLVAEAPQLLPDNKEWSGKLYKTVSKDIKHAHVVGDAITMAARLGDRCEHEVVKMGLRLGKQLMELVQDDEDASWALLASFWSEIVLYVAPSDDLKAHKEAIAHGTELLTLIWALLAHAGITTRPSSTGNAA
ncbi:uncharacterized protein [Miscanthus floridulus]|uniref:uncharacterized protein isoform X2 n=1 Tax=Miscanthus floridulus TaxID=154761 RepID=UPI00345A893D